MLTVRGAHPSKLIKNGPSSATLNPQNSVALSTSSSLPLSTSTPVATVLPGDHIVSPGSVPFLQPSHHTHSHPTSAALVISSQVFMILFIWSLLLAVAVLAILTLHLWRRATILEETLRVVAPTAYAELFSQPHSSSRRRTSRHGTAAVADDEEKAGAGVQSPPPPPYSQDVGSRVVAELKPQRRTLTTVYEVADYEYLDCDCYDGDSWASLPVEECRCLRAARGTMSEGS